MSVPPSWKPGFATNGFTRYSLKKALAAIKHAGFKNVEILADRPHLFPGAKARDKAYTVAHQIHKLNLSVGALNCNTVAGYYDRDFREPIFEPSLANPESEARNWRVQYTLTCMDIAEILETDLLVINSGRMNPGCPPEKGLQYLHSSLEVLLAEAERRGLRLALEYEPGLLIERADEAVIMLKQFDSPNLGINLDLGHSWVAGEDPILIIEMLQDNLFHIHLEDIKDRKHYHLIPGEGDMPLRSILAALDRLHYTGSVMVELYTYPDQAEKAAAASFQYLQQEIFHGLH